MASWSKCTRLFILGSYCKDYLWFTLRLIETGVTWFKKLSRLSFYFWGTIRLKLLLSLVCGLLIVVIFLIDSKMMLLFWFNKLKAPAWLIRFDYSSCWRRTDGGGRLRNRLKYNYEGYSNESSSLESFYLILKDFNYFWKIADRIGHIPTEIIQ